MKHKKVSSLFALLIASLSAQAQFTAGNLVVLQEGTGAAALTSAGTAIFLDQYTTSGALVNALAIPTAGSTALVNSGTATSEGGLTLSGNGQYLVLAGYNTAAGTAGVAASTSATIARGVATVDAGGNYSLAATTSSSFSANNIRSGASDGSGNYWAVGGNSGTVYLGGGTAASVQTTSANNRILQDIGGNLYFSTGSGTRGIYSISGTPTTASSASILFATGASSSPYDFAFNAGQTIAYVADDNTSAAGGIQRWDLISSVWTLSYTLGTGVANIGARGLAVDFSGGNPIVYATTAEGSANRLISITDTGAGSTATTLATAGINTIYRGLDFAPTAVPEPSTLAFGSLGLAAIGFFRRNRKA